MRPRRSVSGKEKEKKEGSGQEAVLWLFLKMGQRLAGLPYGSSTETKAKGGQEGSETDSFS